MRWSKGALIEVAPSTCIGAEKNCRAAYLKLLFGVVNGRLWKWVEAVVRSEGIPCLQSRVGSVIKALQPMLDVPSWNAKRSFSEMNSVVSNIQNNVNTLPFLHGVLVSIKWTQLTLVVSSPQQVATSMVFVGFLLHAWPLLSSRCFLGLSIGCLTVFSLSVDLKEPVA